jgi:hypothetical protein
VKAIAYDSNQIRVSLAPNVSYHSATMQALAKSFSLCAQPLDAPTAPITKDIAQIHRMN